MNKKFESLPRKHASFYNWHDRNEKEEGIMEYFMDPRNHKGIHNYVKFDIPNSDPPDAIVFTEDGDEVSLEIMELVNKEAINAQINIKPNYYLECEKWSDLKYFESELNNRIEIKQKKCLRLFEQGKEVHLLFHTDEGWLEAYCENHLAQGIKINSHDFRKIWLMLSYDSKINSCKIIQLN
jgi:hypothetical protein